MLGIILFLAFMIVSLSIFLLRKPTNEKLYKLALGSYIAFFLLFLTLFVYPENKIWQKTTPTYPENKIWQKTTPT
ncbi:hypothetical protein [Aeribacillus sp. FSL M8-0254]|uniref:hypothetical protein n=1 Tax=Aeribacillus sp. FSL M8-0254 TaxID=2954577 RepID=UPI0030F74C11